MLGKGGIIILYFEGRLQLAGKRGARCYVAVAGGIDTPTYLGSRSTFPGGKLGGVQVKPLKSKLGEINAREVVDPRLGLQI